MRKPLKPLLFGTVLGLLIGGSLRYVDNPRTASSTPSLSSSERVHPAPPEVVVASTPPNPLPRPTLEEVLQLGRYSDAETLTRYLADASIDEIVALMESIWKDDTDLNNLRWMVEMRGLEVDPDAMQVAAKGATGNQAFISLLTTWVKMDPIAALQADLREHSQLTRSVMYGMLTGDLDQAIAAIKAVQPDSPTLKEFEDLKLTQLANKDPQAALAEVMLLTDEQDRGKRLAKVLGSWSETDPLSAIQWMEKHKDVRFSGDMMARAVVNLAKDQPNLARLKLEALPSGDNRIYAEQAVMTELATQDRDAALEWVRKTPNNPQRDFLVSSLLEALEKEPETLIELMREFGSYYDLSQGNNFGLKLEPSRSSRQGSRPDYYSSITKAALELAKESPKEALLALRSFGVDDPTEIVNIWIKQDPEAAANWAADLAESEYSTNVQLALVNAWAAKSPEDVAAFMMANGLAKRADLSQALTKRWVEQDANAAIAWAIQRDDPIRDEVLKATLTEVSLTDPLQALQHVNEIRDPEAQHEAITHATRSWRIQDPEGVMTWLLSQPPEVANDDIVNSTAVEWVLSQPQSASEWIGSMVPGPQKDQAVAGIVGALISTDNPTKDYTSAEIWARTISDPALRQQRLKDIAEAR